MAESAIELTMEATLGAFSFDAVLEPGKLSAWDTVIEVDGTPHSFAGGTHHRLTCSPGQHRVEVYFRGRRAMGALGVLGVKVGRQEMDVDIVPGGTMRLCYRASWGWRTLKSGATLTEI